MNSKKSKAFKSIIKYCQISIALILALLFIIKFAGPQILRQYIAYGIGDCQSIPILCMEPEEKIIQPSEDLKYIQEDLVFQKFSRLCLSSPKSFALVQELTQRPYYKKHKKLDKGDVIYLLYQDPGAFLKLYPDVKKQGVADNFMFIDRLMRARINKINNITDAFFVIMKSIFTPDVGSQSIAKMIRFRLHNKRGFIIYNQTSGENYFDCGVIDEKDNFFKVYIKDKSGRLDLNKVFSIIYTIQPLN
ncbi:MAG: hypothetical protein M0Q96_04180 [Candidatus Omnitrophica bacterium]|jgi:hypothetical protein|nr:hypothetical protein [Candidatus Omnitrophota bacterium]